MKSYFLFCFICLFSAEVLCANVKTEENHQNAITELKKQLQESKWKDQIKSVKLTEEYPTVYFGGYYD